MSHPQLQKKKGGQNLPVQNFAGRHVQPNPNGLVGAGQGYARRDPK